MNKSFFISTRTFILLIGGYLILLSSKANAQPSLNIFSGYGKSSFENMISQTEYLPIGAQLMFGVPVFNLGIEASYAAIPFTFNILDRQTQRHIKEIQFNQLYIGSIIKINLAVGSFIPYGRFGCGLYTGKEAVSWNEEEKKAAEVNGIQLLNYKIPLKNSLGFNLGTGFELMFGRYNGLFFEYVYHLISRRENIPDGLTFKANYWVIQAGYKFNFI